MMCAWAIFNRCFVILKDRSINAYVTIVIVIRQIILVDFVHRLVTTCGDAAKQNHVYHNDSDLFLFIKQLSRIMSDDGNIIGNTTILCSSIILALLEF